MDQSLYHVSQLDSAFRFAHSNPHNRARNTFIPTNHSSTQQGTHSPEPPDKYRWVSWYFFQYSSFPAFWAPVVAQIVKHLPAMWETWVQSLGWEDPLEKFMATHSSILAWRIPWTEEPDRLQSTGLKEPDTTQRLLNHHHSEHKLS